MEDSLLELKEQFCKWYCLNKIHADYEFDPDDYCNMCMVSEYIRFSRDELGK